MSAETNFMSSHGRLLGQSRRVVLQAKIPVNARRTDPYILRDYVGQFLRVNLTPDLSENRYKLLGTSVPSSVLLSKETTTILRSIRISFEMDAQLSEYAGIMQMKKRDVVQMAITMGISKIPWKLSMVHDFHIKRRGTHSYAPKW